MDIDSYMAAVAPFAGNFAPKNWATCQGQLMPLNQYSALFSLLGTNYGGNGVQTFGLPNLSGRVPIGAGQSPGTSTYVIGETAGSENVTLLLNNLPAHSHQATAEATVVMQQSTAAATQKTPTATSVLASPTGSYGGDAVDVKLYAPAPGTTSIPANLALSTQLGISGQGAPTHVVQPVLALTMCICISGLYPPRE